MKEFVVTAPRTIEFREYQEPELGADQVRVKAILSAIKHGTEMALYRGTSPFVSQVFDQEYRLFLPADNGGLYPCNLAAWDVGEVIEVGSQVTGFRVGDKAHCRMPHRPTNTLKADALHHLGDMQPGIAVFADPAVVALLAVHDAHIKVGDFIAVYGLGAIGLLAVQLARLSGADLVFAVDPIAPRRALAEQFGADASFDPTACDAALEIKKATSKRGVDIALEISGAYPALQSAIRALQPCGTLVPASFYSGKGAALELGAEWHHNRINVVCSMPGWNMPHRSYPLWYPRRMENTVLKMLGDGRLVVEPMIGRRYGYEDAAEAYKFIDEHPEEGVKTFLTYA
jgi:threonine dehydrogenase-like Zn-dependent dehydrogenase